MSETPDVSIDFLKPVRQVNEPCPKCGSSYRRGDFCNMPECKAYAPETVSEKDEGFSRLGKPIRGRIWDSKLHKYIS